MKLVMMNTTMVMMMLVAMMMLTAMMMLMVMMMLTAVHPQSVLEPVDERATGESSPRFSSHISLLCSKPSPRGFAQPFGKQKEKLKMIGFLVKI